MFIINSEKRNSSPSAPNDLTSPPDEGRVLFSGWEEIWNPKGSGSDSLSPKQTGDRPFSGLRLCSPHQCLQTNAQRELSSLHTSLRRYP